MTQTADIGHLSLRESYDSVIVGASPTSLFEAMTLEFDGKKVLVVEASDRLGGAWTTRDLPGVGAVECGTHYLFDLPKVYSFIGQIDGVELLPAEPIPRYVMPRRVMGRRTEDFRSRWAGKVSPRVYSGEITMRSIRNLVSPYYRYARATLGLEGRPKKSLQYICGGTPALVSALSNLVSRRQFKIELNREIDEVRVNSSERLVYCKIGDRNIVAKELFVPGSAHLPNVFIDDKKIDLPGEVIPSVQLHMVVRGAPKQKISFIQFTGSAFANLASDLTSTCQPPLAGGGRRILSASVRDDVPHNTATAQAILDELKMAGLLENGASLETAYWSRFDLPQRSRDELHQISEKSKGLFRTLYAHSFSVAISENASRWLPALVSPSAGAETGNSSDKKITRL
tara:strand:+ start:3426 stop:4622 length:1197 start_codon:yes stop_codon:yes gene_type:complete